MKAFLFGTGFFALLNCVAAGAIWALGKAALIAYPGANESWLVGLLVGLAGLAACLWIGARLLRAIAKAC